MTAARDRSPPGRCGPMLIKFLEGASPLAPRIMEVTSPPIRRHALGGVLAYGRAGVRCLSCQAPHSMRYGPMEWLDPSALLALVVVTPWKIVGWSGSAIFSIRFFLQWIASERA